MRRFQVTAFGALAFLLGAVSIVDAQMELPPGSYKYSCRRCDFDGRVLTCSCRTSGGQYYTSSLDWGGQCQANVSNHESTLVCADR